MRRSAGIALLLFCLFSHGAAAQDSAEASAEETLEYLKNEILSMHIDARILDSSGELLWNVESTKVTLSGKSVNVKLEGENLVIFAQLIPYYQEEGNVYLQARGQVFISEKSAGEIEYYSAMESLPVEIGERVIFFPLGRAIDEKENIYNIELAIQIVPYTEGN